MASGEGERQPAGGAPSVVHFTGTANILQARERLEAETGMEAMAAFHRWRTSSLKTHYGRQLRDILTDVRKDEGRLKHAQSSLTEYRNKEAALNNELSKLRVENGRAASQMESFLADYHEMEKELRQVCNARDTALARAEAAEATLEVQDRTRGERGDTVDRIRLTSAMEEARAAQEEQSKLLDALSQREEAVAGLGQELRGARQQLEAAREDVAGMEGVVRATGERAAIAEARAAELEAENARLKEASRQDYAERRRLQSAAAEIEELKKQIGELSSVNASLAASRDELRGAVDAVTQKLAGAEGRVEYFRRSAEFLSAMNRILEGSGPGHHMEAYARKLAQQLDASIAENAELAGNAESLTTAVSQRDEALSEQRARIRSLEARNSRLEDATRKNQQLQDQLDNAKEDVAEQKSLRVAAEHRAESLASQNSLKDYILKVRAKTANEDITAALERLTKELGTRTEDAAALAGCASLAESRLDSVNGLQSALAAKIAELETMRAGEAGAADSNAAVAQTPPAPEQSLLPGSIRGATPITLVPQEALEAAERRRARAEANVAHLQHVQGANMDAIAAFVERSHRLRRQIDLMAVFHVWRTTVSESILEQYASSAGAKAHMQTMLARLTRRSIHRVFQAKARYMFASWRAVAARRFRLAGRWAALSKEAVGSLWDAAAMPQRTGGLIRTRRTGEGGLVLREVAETQTMRLLVKAWQTQVAEAKLEDLTAALPLWIERIGEKRCVERHWTAWRIATAKARLAVQRPAAQPPARGADDGEVVSASVKQHASKASRSTVSHTPSPSRGRIPDARHRHSDTHATQTSTPTRHATTGASMPGAAMREESRSRSPKPGNDGSPQGTRHVAASRRTQVHKVSSRRAVPHGGGSPRHAPATGAGTREEEEEEDAPRKRSASVAPFPQGRRHPSPRASSAPPSRPSASRHAERRKLPPDMPVVAAFGSTVSHDPLALPFALGRPSLRRLSEPDAVPNLSASQAGLSRKARKVEAVVDSLAYALGEVASSLAQGSTRTNQALGRLQGASSSPEAVRSRLVQQGMRGAFAVHRSPGAEAAAQGRAASPGSPTETLPRSPSPTASTGHPSTARDRALTGVLSPRSLMGSPPPEPWHRAPPSPSATEAGIPKELRIPPPASGPQRGHDPGGQARAPSNVGNDMSGRIPSQPPSTQQSSPAKSVRAAASIDERGTPTSPSKLNLPGTGTLIGEQSREFENVLTAGATGFSPRELAELSQRGALLSAQMVPMHDLQATGSHLVISPDSRLLHPTQASAAPHGLPSGGMAAPHSPHQRHSPPPTQASPAQTTRQTVVDSPNSQAVETRNRESPQPPPASAAKGSRMQPSAVSSRLYAPTRASISRAEAVARATARREAEALKVSLAPAVAKRRDRSPSKSRDRSPPKQRSHAPYWGAWQDIPRGQSTQQP